MRIKHEATLNGDHVEGYTFPISFTEDAQTQVINVPISIQPEGQAYDPEKSEPVQIMPHPLGSLNGRWLYRRRIVTVSEADGMSRDEVIISVKHAILLRDKAFKKMGREIEAFENLQKVSSARRERIPEAVKLFVWQRDEGKCVKCGGREQMEFDHIIPIALGGSNTERNIQLLCERCNREKGAKL